MKTRLIDAVVKNTYNLRSHSCRTLTVSLQFRPVEQMVEG